MTFDTENFNSITTVDLRPFPLLREHLSERRSSKTYSEFPEMLEYKVLKIDDKPIGVIGYELCSLEDEVYFYVSPLEITKDYRHKHYGLILIENVISYSLDLGLKGICLFCSSDLISYYKQENFEVRQEYSTKEHILMIYKNS